MYTPKHTQESLRIEPPSSDPPPLPRLNAPAHVELDAKNSPAERTNAFFALEQVEEAVSLRIARVYN